MDATEPDWDNRLKHYMKRWGPGYPTRPEEEPWARKVQPAFLRKQGLLPNHVFLDLGCGWLRGTIELIDYLEDGNFYGIDISKTNIDKAKARAKQSSKHLPNLAVASRFEINQIWPKVQFDYILAASLFTHIYPPDLQECLHAVSTVLGGKFYATIFKDNTVTVNDGWCGTCSDHRPDHSTKSRRQNFKRLDFCYNTSWISEVAKEHGLRVVEIGPTEIGQFMLEISHTPVN
jgi:cyclopropane fatty-acyl-phospholipid synthase-like methyltransferase